MRFSASLHGDLLGDLHYSVGVARTLSFKPPLDVQSSWTVACIFFQALLSSLGPVLLCLPEEPEM